MADSVDTDGPAQPSFLSRFFTFIKQVTYQHIVPVQHKVWTVPEYGSYFCGCVKLLSRGVPLKHDLDNMDHIINSFDKFTNFFQSIV